MRPSGEGGPDRQADGRQWVTLNCRVTWLNLHIRKVPVKASVQRVRVRWREGGQWGGCWSHPGAEAAQPLSLVSVSFLACGSKNKTDLYNPSTPRGWFLRNAQVQRTLGTSSLPWWK